MARTFRGERCEESAGFLFAHECDQVVVASCSNCGKAICKRHLLQESGQVYCVACARETPDAQKQFQGNAFFYGRHWYPTHDTWGLSHDEHDLTEADGESTLTEGDETFESDPGAS